MSTRPAAPVVYRRDARLERSGSFVLAAALVLACPASIGGQQPAGSPSVGPPPARQPSTGPPSEVTFYGNPSSPISSGVVIPAGRASVWISGTTPPVLKADAPRGARERFGDTKTQAAGILKSIEGQLAARGLSMRDVVYIRAYLVPDPQKENKIDVAGWNVAYSEVFGTAANPTKTARSTVGVLALLNADWLIEVEAFAVFPIK
jgi:enamine deaminase RidA (YjgF/YER057c/UK114 family)